jgi:peroxiredoxin Q/BCP
MELLAQGSAAPEFKAQTQSGEWVSLSDFRGKKVILYFYPQDSTPTCTKEACNLRDNHQILTDKGFVVLGVSPDGVSSHQKFATKQNLPFTLLADTDHNLVRSYKVWGEKQMYGKKYEGVHRVTYVIGEDGRIEQVVPKVNAAAHAEQILDLYK